MKCVLVVQKRFAGDRMPDAVTNAATDIWTLLTAFGQSNISKDARKPPWDFDVPAREMFIRGFPYIAGLMENFGTDSKADFRIT